MQYMVKKHLYMNYVNCFIMELGQHMIIEGGVRSSTQFFRDWMKFAENHMPEVDGC